MNLQKIPVDQLKPAKYNPRKDLKPGDPAYEKIKRSLHTYGYVDPVIWNEVTGNIVGGHQRYKVLIAEGVKEIDCVVVHIEDPQDEKALNIAPNKAAISAISASSVITTFWLFAIVFTIFLIAEMSIMWRQIVKGSKMKIS